jgi:Rrf2 family protein
MKVSTKGRYGLRVLLDIALHSEATAVALRDIARRQEISQKYLWQVINPLKAAGILRATRGAHGGYVLARPLESVTLLDVISILEGADSLVACVAAPETCGRSVSCTAREAWVEVDTKLNDALRGITLKSLIERHKDQESRVGPTYSI